MKFLLWGLIIAAVALWYLHTRKQLRQGGDRQPPGEAMVRCEHCGIHLPASETVRSNSGRLYCSAEHRRLHDSDPS